MEFMADGTMTVKKGSNVIVENGRYTVTGDLFEVPDDSQVDSQVCDNFGGGSYIWSLDGERIVMEVVEDDCEVRRAAFTSGLRPVA